MTLTFGSLFAGIGGFDLGLERAGMECRWQVEIDDYCQKVLAKHWPDVERFGDVREVGKHNLEAVDLICGGFPCQPHSVAGKRRGAEDDRNLWPEFSRVVAELRPRWVVAENVPGIVTTYLDTVLSDLESQGYTCGTFNLPACGFDAPHRRGRIFIVANDERGRCQPKGKRGGVARMAGRTPNNSMQAAESGTDVADADEQGRQVGERQAAEGIQRIDAPDRTGRTFWLPEPDVGRVAHGVPKRVDRLRALGNAVVPQVAEWIGHRIMEAQHA